MYNAMTPMGSREPGVVGAALADEGSWFGIIADGHHSHPASFRAAVRAKQRGGAVLVTDAMASVGGGGDGFTLGDQPIRVEGGRCVNAEGTLAGSHLDMLSAVENAARFAGIDWLEALRMASVYPARALGLGTELGRVRPGQRANLLALDDQHRVLATWIDGDCLALKSS
jgi:N-acetylglucosamine-6-phosphate deacetylase